MNLVIVKSLMNGTIVHDSGRNVEFVFNDGRTSTQTWVLQADPPLSRRTIQPTSRNLASAPPCHHPCRLRPNWNDLFHTACVRLSVSVGRFNASATGTPRFRGCSSGGALLQLAWSRRPQQGVDAVLMENPFLPTSVNVVTSMPPLGAATSAEPGTRGILSPSREERRRQRQKPGTAEITIAFLTVCRAHEDNNRAQRPESEAWETTGLPRRPTLVALASAQPNIDLAVACGHRQSLLRRITPRVLPVLPPLLRFPAGYPILSTLRGTPLLLKRSLTTFPREPWKRGGDTEEKIVSEMCEKEHGWPGTPALVGAAAAVFCALPSTVAAAAIYRAWAVIAVAAVGVSTVVAALRACCARIGRSNGEVALFTGEKWLIWEDEE